MEESVSDHADDKNGVFDDSNLDCARVSTSELALLARQGFISEERLTSGSSCYKLRFRGDPSVAKGSFTLALTSDLQKQFGRNCESYRPQRRDETAIRRPRRLLRRLMRETKQRVKPYLLERGVVFHGFAMRLRHDQRGNLAEPGHDRPTNKFAYHGGW